MTIGYLTQTVSSTSDANGFAVAQLAPDTGEYWAPSLVRVGSSNNQPAPTPLYAALYHGASNVIDYTTFLDETYLGFGDTSSVIAGTIVQRGEALTVKWRGGTPGAVATLSIFGRNASTLPEVAGVLSPVPGARFRGADQSTLLPFDLSYYSNVVN